MGGSEEPVDSSYLVDQRDLFPERVLRRSAGLREAGAVERIGIIQELDPAHQRGHGAAACSPAGRERVDGRTARLQEEIRRTRLLLQPCAPA